MASLLDKLKTKALDAVNDPERQEEWVEKGFDKALEEARGLIPEGGDDEGEIKALKETAGYALDKLEQNKDVIVKLGANGLRSALTLVGLGQYDEAAKHAALVYLRESAGWDEVNAAITTTARDGNQKKRELDEARSKVMDALKDIGTTAAKALLPLLLAVF